MNVAVPISWQAIGFLLLGLLVGAIFLMSTASYSRIETASGVVVPRGGWARVVSQRSGIVADVPVAEGQVVRAGAMLALIRTGDVLESGRDSLDETMTSLEAAERGLVQQEQQIAASASAQRAELASRISGLQAGISALDEQIRLQTSQVGLAKEDLDRARKIAERGFVSKRDLSQREDAYVARQQQLSQLRQDRTTRLAGISEARSGMAQATATAGVQVAALSSQRSDLARSRTVAETGSATRLTAPMDGQVTALVIHAGQSIKAQEPVMLLVSSGGDLHAELQVPSAARGFIRTGQDVSLAIDAFPYQRFGTIPGKVLSVASAPMAPEQADGSGEPTYLVVVSLSRQSMKAIGQDAPLMPGMALSARITLERQSLLRWLFEPLFSVAKR